MFAFGFGGILVITQLYSLGFKNWQKWLMLAVYLGSAFWVYSSRGWIKLNEIIRIPLIEYLPVFALAGLIALGLEINRRLLPSR